MFHFYKIFILICVGEIIFSLPFHISRFFRPSFLNTFGITNTELGDLFSSYGIFSFLSYFPGGLLADRFSFRKLISLSLFLTGLGGIYLYTIPSTSGLFILFSYWGITTILLFWAPLIKATKDWGADKNQGIAFGILDGGRGLVASGMASIILIFFTTEISQSGIQSIILFYTTLTFLFSIISYFSLSSETVQIDQSDKMNLTHLKELLKNQNLWLISFIIVCAYCGYKALDNYGLFANQVLGMTEVESSKFVTYMSYSRVIVAVFIGFLADRLNASKVLTILFSTLTLFFFLLPFYNSSLMTIILLNLVITVIAIYGLRAIYFALIQESNIKNEYTGTAVGIISVVGYTPDIFFASITGRILDSANPQIAFERYFLFLGFLTLIGVLSSYKILKNNQRNNYV
jgi:nitrate/nitrite transporter NarK